jgi:hypothetical protein
MKRRLIPLVAVAVTALGVVSSLANPPNFRVTWSSLKNNWSHLSDNVGDITVARCSGGYTFSHYQQHEEWSRAVDVNTSRSSVTYDRCSTATLNYGGCGCCCGHYYSVDQEVEHFDGTTGSVLSTSSGFGGGSATGPVSSPGTLLSGHYIHWATFVDTDTEPTVLYLVDNPSTPWVIDIWACRGSDATSNSYHNGPDVTTVNGDDTRTDDYWGNVSETFNASFDVKAYVGDYMPFPDYTRYWLQWFYYPGPTIFSPPAAGGAMSVPAEVLPPADPWSSAPGAQQVFPLESVAASFITTCSGPPPP